MSEIGSTDTTALVDWLESSLSALAAHDKHCGSAPSTWFEIGTAQGPQGLQAEVWWNGVPSRFGSEMLWDRRHFAGLPASAVEQARTLLPQQMAGKPLKWKELPVQPVKPPTAPPPLFRYHPQRVRTLLPFARTMSTLATSCARGMTMEGLQTLAGAYFTATQQASDVRTQPLRMRIESDSRDARGMQRALEGYAMFVFFEAAGRQIFDIPPLLTEMFRHTDIDQVPVELLKFPYQMQYIYFGAQDDMEIRPGWKLDGAYVQQLPDGAIQVCVTAAPPSVDAFKDFASDPEPFYQQTIPATMAQMTLGEAVDVTLAQTMAELRKQVTDTEFARQSEEAGRELGADVVSRRERAAAQELASIQVRHDAYLKMLQLVANALCYLTGYPDDVQVEWPAETPERMLAQVQASGSVKQQRNATSKLLAMGYTAIHTCGRRLDEEVRRTGAHPAELSGEERKGYTWVKGHQLWQAYGPGRTLRKLQWRIPRLARMRKVEDEEPPGHIYLVT